MGTSIYICTVGTGTTGKHSNLPQGLINAIGKRAPAQAILMPSSSSDSITTAELVVEELEHRGIPALVGASFSDFDDLVGCRREMADLLRTQRKENPEAHIILNATSGTKQMTTAAVLAGIQCDADDLEFIAGQRADGVVKTGTERLIQISGRRFRGEQAARQRHHPTQSCSARPGPDP